MLFRIQTVNRCLSFGWSYSIERFSVNWHVHYGDRESFYRVIVLQRFIGDHCPLAQTEWTPTDALCVFWSDFFVFKFRRFTECDFGMVFYWKTLHSKHIGQSKPTGFEFYGEKENSCLPKIRVYSHVSFFTVCFSVSLFNKLFSLVCRFSQIRTECQRI